MRIGTAAWTIPAPSRSSFPEEESQLTRYSQVFNAVEINSTFYKFHQQKTFERWSLETPSDFQFSVKLHQQFTHQSELKPKVGELKIFFNAVHGLGDKWKVLLIQFAGKTEFHEKKMGRFYELIRRHFEGHIVLEPRNETWVSKESLKLLKEFQVSKVVADPERCPFRHIDYGIHYLRLHGTPVIYRSSYSEKYLRKLSRELKPFKNPWVMFDNTSYGAATENALFLTKS